MTRSDMGAPLKVVNIDCAFENKGGYAWQEASVGAAGGEFVLCRARTEDQIIFACRDAGIVVVEYADTPVTERVIAHLPACLAILKCAVGVDNIDVEAASEQGIVVCNVADYCTEEVSDHAIALLLAAVRRVPEMDRRVRAGGWAPADPGAGLRRVRNLTLGLIGFGRIGRAVARKMSGFRMRILASDPNVSTEPQAGVELTSLERVLRESDVISIHTALTDGTRGMLGLAQLQLMKPSAILVNTSRGAVINEEALICALEEKRIAGAALDVTVEEPLSAASPLRTLESVIVTPHCGASSSDAIWQWRAIVVESLEAVLKGRWPPFPANPAVTPRIPLLPFRAAGLER